MMDISGKTAIVTGAASGIGLGIATALAEAGANVVMADIQKDAVEQAAHGLSGTNKRVMPRRIDVSPDTRQAVWGGHKAGLSKELIWPEGLARMGLDRKRVGGRVVEAISPKAFSPSAGAVRANVIRARHRRIEDALNSPWVTHY